MHGLINSAFQGFVTDTYGADVWKDVYCQAEVPYEDFEAMLIYDDALLLACVHASSRVLLQTPQVLLEDMGTYLVTHPPLDPLRRLLRFGGAEFTDFLFSLEELADRGRLVMPDLELPKIEVTQVDDSLFQIMAEWEFPGIGAILLGALRAMADDYGVLAILTLQEGEDRQDCLSVRLHDIDHAEGNDFHLGEVRA